MILKREVGMDTENENRIKKLENRIAAYDELMPVLFAEVKKFHLGMEIIEERVNDLFRLDGLNWKNHRSYNKFYEQIPPVIDSHAVAIEALQRVMLRMEDVYYHIFPERLTQDAKFSEQLAALKIKLVPDVDSKEV
jgi:uncharacterized coiled-coil protein SlyX